jgi:(2S)-methylsuccinyl-CoA dehydrogenase
VSSLPDRALSRCHARLEEMTKALRRLTHDGERIDDFQVPTRRLAGLATRYEALKALAAYSDESRDGREAPWIDEVAESWAAETALLAAETYWLHGLDYQIRPDVLSGVGDAALLDSVRRGLGEVQYRRIGEELIERGAANNRHVPGDTGDVSELRSATRRFAQEVVAPEAERIHRGDLLVPEHFVRGMAELGYFGMSIPEEYGGVGMTNLMMVVATEELSAASLASAGSLITRPEILANALLQGGTEEQKRAWLPRIASGELMVAVSVTEPNVGSDVARVSCRAEPVTIGDQRGYVLNGAKAWCTYAGRAEILALLARTDPDPASGHKGLSLFIVEKSAFDGHEFVARQPGGGVLTGKADATIGYRGMHSFTLQFENYFVPAENLVGGESGRGKGFYLQMGGFAVGRLQTGGRATGLAQASLEAAVKYAKERPQFGRPIVEYQSTQYEIGRMAVKIEAARQLTYGAARAMDENSPRAALMAAMAKLLACRVAVEVSQAAQVLHGGWGYAEEYAISRYVCDALVLPIFEGVEPILEMKVVGRALLGGT